MKIFCVCQYRNFSCRFYSKFISFFFQIWISFFRTWQLSDQSTKSALKGLEFVARHDQLPAEFMQCTRSLNKIVLKVLWFVLDVTMNIGPLDTYQIWGDEDVWCYHLFATLSNVFFFKSLTSSPLGCSVMETLAILLVLCVHVNNERNGNNMKA